MPNQADEHGDGTQSGAVPRDPALLREAELRDDDAAAWDEWAGEEADAWDGVVADGLDDASR